MYTPALDVFEFLPNHSPKCKNEDKSLRKAQDLVLDVAGPLAMAYEMLAQTRNNNCVVDARALWPYLTKALQLLGSGSNHRSGKRRAQILAKVGNKYTSLSQESWYNSIWGEV